MKFQIVFAVIAASIKIFSSKKTKTFPTIKKLAPATTFQSVNMNNNVNANSNSFALSAGICGDANAASYSNGANYNQVGQSTAAPSTEC